MKNISILLMLFTLILSSCKTDEPERIIRIQTGTITGITALSCTVQGAIIDAGDEGIIQYGHCWSTSEGPTTSNMKTELGFNNSTGSFNSILTGLWPNTKYYVRAYATNSANTAYGNEIEFLTIGETSTISDFDGNVYQTVHIGNQIWMSENLKVTHYSDGKAIMLVEGTSAWEALRIIDKAYCYYSNSTANRDVYGALYTWAAAMNGAASSDANPGGVQGVCPTGWHLPSDTEWTELTEFLGGESQAGGKLKEIGTTHWSSPNTGATNSSGFTALPGGYRQFYGGYFSNLGGTAFFWSSTAEDISIYAWILFLHYDSSAVGRDGRYISIGQQVNGFSVRCLRDD